MKIAIFGYGKMGKEVEQVALERGHDVILKIDVSNADNIDSEKLREADAVIEFTNPDSAYSNILKCFEADTAVISGTTGWLDKLPIVKKMCSEEDKTLFYAPNFSIGVNLFFKLNKLLSGLMQPHAEDYDVSVSETHHIHKKDAPSGTAIKISDDIIAGSNRYQSRKPKDGNQSPEKSEILVSSKREGEVFGIHNVKYESETDIIKIEHELKSRKSLALGAVIAAEFTLQNRGFLTMDNLLKL